MNLFSYSLVFIAGICASFGLLYLFIGFKRKQDRNLNLTFAVFSLSYAGANLAALAAYSSNESGAYLSANILNTYFAVSAFIFLLWFVAIYTGVKPRLFLWLLTAVFLFIGLINLLFPELLHGTAEKLIINTLPWGETYTVLDETEVPLLPIVILAQLTTIGFILYATIRQFLRGERQAAVLLGIGVLWFVLTLVVDILVEIGVIEFFFLSDFGFLGFAVVMGLQMANRAIKAEKELADYRLNLEKMVALRTEELEVTQEQLLVQAQQQAASAERSRLARDLHDVVTQILFSINLIAMSLPRLWERDPEMASRSTVELQRLTRGALAEMRILLRELRPHTIITTDLSTLLTQLAHGLSARHDIPVSVEVCKQCTLPEDVHVALYRIAQEAMNNVAKHAEATQVLLSLEKQETAVSLIIGDNGQGFDINQVPSDHMGLDIMKERVQDIDAQLTIDANPGQGTTISVHWSPETNEATAHV